MEGAVLGLFLVFTIIGPLVLYVLVRTEHDDRETMSRDEAERAARQDTRNTDDSSRRR